MTLNGFFERADSGKRVTLWSLIGLVLVPIVIAGAFVLATKGADTRFGQTTAAIVNNDDGTTLDGKQVPMGRQLAAALVDLDTQNYKWVQSTDEDAQDGLKTGKYVAVVTIPEGFSSAVLSPAKDKPIDARQATIRVQTSDVSPVNNAVISRALVEAARTKFNTDMSEQFLDGVFVGFNDMRDQFRTMTDAATELQDGAGQLADGTSELTDGSGQLADGLSQLDANGGKLSGGVTELATGASALSNGAGQLANGAGTLSDGLGQMANQTRDLPDQTQQLATGAKDLSQGVDQYTGGVTQLASGASDLSQGVDEYTRNIDGVVQKVDAFADELSKVNLDELKKFQGNTGGDQPGASPQDIKKFFAGVQNLNDGLTGYQKALEKQAANLKSQVGKVTTLNQAVKLGVMTSEQASQVRGQLCVKLPDGAKDPACPVVESTYVTGLLSGVSSGLSQAATGLEAKDPQTGQSLLGGAKSLSDAAGTINTRIAQLEKQLEGLKGLDLGKLSTDFDSMKQFLDQFKAGTSQVMDASSQLRAGASGVADGAKKLSDNGSSLRDGAKQLADGVAQLSQGVGPLVDGIGQSADGSKQLVGAANKLSDGAGQLASGAGDLSRGLRQYTFGVTQAADASTQLNQGAQQLSDGASQLADGTAKFTDGLKQGKDQIPSYTAPERDKLSTAVSAAIDGSASKFVSGSMASAVALLLVLALWVGSLVTYMVVRAVSASALTSRRSSWSIMLKGLVPGLAIAAVQALVVTGLAEWLLQLPVSRAIHLFAFALFASLVFTVLNFALAGLFNSIGRVISLIMIVVAVAARLMSGVPGPLGTAAGFMPPTPGIDGVLAIATATPGAAGAWGQLLLWLLLGVGASIVAVAKSRSLGSASALARA